MFQFLSEKINQAVKRLKGEDKITAQNISTTLKEIRRALVGADVHYNIAKEFVARVKKKALGTEIKISASPGELFIKIVHEELTELMGRAHCGMRIDGGNPSIVLLVGLQGAGKTTLACKLGAYFKRKNKNVLLTSCDVYRPAAQEQLETLGASAGVDVFLNKVEKDPLVIVKEALEHAGVHHKKVVIVDTAGRQVVDERMMEEIMALKENLKPQETLFVVDAMMGQTAIDTARAFNARVDLDGVVLTKMDGDTRGGVALTIREVTGKPIKMISTGEKVMDLEDFHPG